MMVSRSVGIMPNPLDKREIVFTNLLLLNFDPVTMERREKIPFNRDMFALPNKKAMEVVMYFLFSKLNPQMTHEEFRDCWPVKNKVDEQKFRKTCYNWVTRLSKEESDTYFPRVVQSLFHSPGGDKFYDFLRLFSIYVLKVVMLRDHSRHISIPTFPSKSIHSRAFTQVISKSLKIHTSLHRKRFLDLAQYCIEVQQHWASYATDLSKESRSLKKKKREIEKLLEKEVNYKGEQIAKSIAISSSYQKEVDAIQRTRELQKVRCLWKGLEDFFLEHQPQVVASVVNNQANKHCINAASVEVKVPDLLLREFERDIHLNKITNTYVGGKLNLLSLVQLWNLSLTLIKDKIQQESVPGFDDSSPKLQNYIARHQALLANAEYLRSTLSKETLPELKKSVDELRTKVYGEMMELENSYQCHLSSFNLGLGLLPATPPVSFTAAETPASKRIASFQESLQRTPTTVSTPDVIHAWSESLRGSRHPAQGQSAHLLKPSRQASEQTKSQKSEQSTKIPQSRNHRNHFQAEQQKHRKTTSRKGVLSGQLGSRTIQTQRIKSRPARDQTKEPRTEPRKTLGRDRERTSAASNVANQIIGVMSVDKPASHSSSSQSSSSSSPKPQAINHPLEALNETAFVSRDVISRTPAPQETYNPTNRKTEDTITPQGNLLNSSGGLIETILDQVTKSTSKAVSGGLSLSLHDHHGNENHHGNSHGQSSQPKQLLTPFDFQASGKCDGNNENKQLQELQEHSLTPIISLVDQPSASTSTNNDSTLKRTHRIEKKLFTNETTSVQKLIDFTPVSERLLNSSTISDQLQSPFSLSKIFEQNLSLSKDNKLSQGLPRVSQKTPNDHDSIEWDLKNPKISLFEPVVMNESLTDVTEDNPEDKRSPFGSRQANDDEHEPQRADAVNETDSFKDMDQSDILRRLNKIKAAQHFDFKYLSQEDTAYENTYNKPVDATMETSPPNHVSELKEAQQVQQATPGPNTQGNLDPYRGTEGVFLTPPSGSPGGGPSLLSEKFLLESQNRKSSVKDFSCDIESPMGPDIIGSKHLSSSEKGPETQGLGSSMQIGTSSSEYLWKSIHSPISGDSRGIDGKLLWLTSNGETPKDITQLDDRGLSDEDFLNESMDTSFLVQNTPYHERLSRDVQSSFSSPFDGHNPNPRGSNFSIATSSSGPPITASPAIGQLIDF